MELMIILVVLCMVCFYGAKKEVENPVKKDTKDTMSAQNQKLEAVQPQTQWRNIQWQQSAKENIEKARKRAQNNVKKQAAKMWHEVRKEIVSEKPNEEVEKNSKTTVASGSEAQLQHSKQPTPQAYAPTPEVLSESQLGRVEDLIVKGYEGNLCFERDFLAEAMDMLNCFTVPSDIPDFSHKDDAA